MIFAFYKSDNATMYGKSNEGNDTLGNVLCVGGKGNINIQPILCFERPSKSNITMETVHFVDVIKQKEISSFLKYLIMLLIIEIVRQLKI